MQKEPRSWREILLFVLTDTQERQRLEKLFDPRSLRRWANGDGNPQPQNLRSLIQALPQHRYQLLTLIAQEFPDIAERLELSDVEDTLSTIPSTVYARVLEERAKSTSPLLLWGVGMLVLQNLVKHLSSSQSGVVALFVQCIAPPRGETKVRALREQFLQANALWPTFTTNSETYFWGAESVVGSVVTSCQPAVFHDTKQDHYLLLHPSEHVVRHMNSLAAYPVIQGDRVAGCLLVLSTQPRFFSHMRFEVVKLYSNLLTQAFRECDFYERSTLELSSMSEASLQLLYLSSFREKANALHRTAEQLGTSISYEEAERQVLQRFLLEGVSRDES